MLLIICRYICCPELIGSGLSMTVYGSRGQPRLGIVSCEPSEFAARVGVVVL